MTIAILLAVMQATAVPPLADWPALAPLPWRTPPVLGAETTAFVAQEVSAGRCTPPDPRSLTLGVVAQVSREGQVRVVVPQAIGCPAVEQYAAGLVTGYARGNLRDTVEGWYRVTVTFTLPPG